MKKRKEDFERAYEDLSKSDKKELKEIGEDLENFRRQNPNIPIGDKNLKKRIVNLCLKLIEETPKNKIFIRETSYIITGNFVWFTYGDKLDEIMDIAGELELPEKYVSKDVFKLWEKMKKKLQKYISK